MPTVLVTMPADELGTPPRSVDALLSPRVYEQFNVTFTNQQVTRRSVVAPTLFAIMAPDHLGTPPRSIDVLLPPPVQSSLPTKLIPL